MTPVPGIGACMTIVFLQCTKLLSMLRLVSSVASCSVVMIPCERITSSCLNGRIDILHSGLLIKLLQVQAMAHLLSSH